MWQDELEIVSRKKGWLAMPQHSFISIPLDIPDIRVTKTEITKAGDLLLTVETLVKSTTCRRCGQTITNRYGCDEPRDLRHLPILGRPVYLRLRPKRFRCPHCAGHPTTTQQLDWYDPQALHTKAYEQRLLVELVNTTLQDVACKEDVSYDALLGILDRWIATTVDWTTVEPFTTLGMDEIALRKGHRNFVAIMTAQTTSGRVQLLAVLPDRLKTTVCSWLASIPEAVRERITTVCSDMWDGYVAAATEVLPSALIVIDRFHVARHYRDAVDNLRKQEVRRLRTILPPGEQSVLDKTLWPLRKAAADLTEAEQGRRDGLLALSEPLANAYRLREELTTIFATARSKADALRRIG